jgi:hypothetical protein
MPMTTVRPYQAGLAVVPHGIFITYRLWVRGALSLVTYRDQEAALITLSAVGKSHATSATMATAGMTISRNATKLTAMPRTRRQCCKHGCRHNDTDRRDGGASLSPATAAQ